MIYEDKFKIDEAEFKLLNRIKNKILYEDRDAVIVIDGETGTGKSVKALHYSYIIDPSISIDRVCFNMSEFVMAILNAKRGQVIIADEAISIFFSRAAMTKESRTVIELMNQIRQKNLCIILCIPQITDLDKAMQEKALIYVNVAEKRLKTKYDKTKTVTVKGNAYIYMDFKKNKAKSKRILYLRAKKSNPNSRMRSPKPLFRSEGTVYDKNKSIWIPVNPDLYKAKKESVLKKYIPKKVDKKIFDPNTLRIFEAFLELRKKHSITSREISQIIGLSERTVNRMANFAEDSLKTQENAQNPSV